MKPNISEFSYGYAVTENLIQWVGTPLTAAPVFPSLIEEGRSGGGYDLKLNFSGIPFFLQFKLSHYMKNRNTPEFQKGLFQPPFYRMYLHPLRHSKQHELMLELENIGNEIYYAAPAFHQVSELNQAYASQKVLASSIFIRPSAIGKLPDQDEHHVSFQLTGNAYRLSIPIQIEFLNGDMLAKHIATKLHQKTLESFSIDDLLVPVSQHMISTIRDYFAHQELNLNVLSDLRPVQRVAYLARMFYGCEMFILREKDQK